MISRFRMKIDVWGQGLMIAALLLLFVFENHFTWTNVMLAVLTLWQLASAAHLLYAYRHIRRLNFLRTALVLLISLPVWFHLVGPFAYVPVAGLAIWYFIQSILDLIKVYNRPRSFWDII